MLNLWQKNGVFDMDIIQPLMDMANGAIVPAFGLEGKEISNLLYVCNGVLECYLRVKEMRGCNLSTIG